MKPNQTPNRVFFYVYQKAILRILERCSFQERVINVSGSVEIGQFRPFVTEIMSGVFGKRFCDIEN